MAKRGLGKGISALIPDYEVSFEGEVTSELKIIDVEPDPDQPRKHFDEEKLKALSESISVHGVIQPIIVVKNGERYTIIAGERRWRAARLAGLKTIPAIIRDYDEIKRMEVALIENLQRENLNPVEEALGYKALMDRFGMTQEKVSERVGKNRSTVANSLRLLALPDDVLRMLEAGEISSGHAKAVLSVAGTMRQSELARQIKQKGLSVRAAEAAASGLSKPKSKAKKTDSQIVDYINDLQDNLSRQIGTKVQIKHNKGKGKIEISYYSDEELERILEILQK